MKAPHRAPRRHGEPDRRRVAAHDWRAPRRHLLLLPRGAGPHGRAGTRRHRQRELGGGHLGRVRGAAHYAAAKAGILGFTRALAQEVASREIRVNAVAPGWIDTEMNHDLNPGLRRAIEQRTPLRRLGDVDDVAHAVLYLASDRAKFVTGQVLSPNGGWYMSQ